MRLRDFFHPTVQDPAGDAGSKTQAGNSNGDAQSPETSALNSKIVQAVSFANAETTQYLPELVQASPDLMAAQTAGIAVQDAATYMNAVMQIALAAQAVIAKKAAEGPLPAIEEIPALLEMQKMVSAAVEVYGAVSKAAGTSAKTIIADTSDT